MGQVKLEFLRKRGDSPKPSLFPSVLTTGFSDSPREIDITSFCSSYTVTKKSAWNNIAEDSARSTFSGSLGYSYSVKHNTVYAQVNWFYILPKNVPIFF